MELDEYRIKAIAQEIIIEQEAQKLVKKNRESYFEEKCINKRCIRCGGIPKCHIYDNNGEENIILSCELRCYFSNAVFYDVTDFVTHQKYLDYTALIRKLEYQDIVHNQELKKKLDKQIYLQDEVELEVKREIKRYRINSINGLNGKDKMECIRKYSREDTIFQEHFSDRHYKKK